MTDLELKKELQRIFDLIDNGNKAEAMTAISLLINDLGGLSD